jgi:hypothetical protein
MKSFVGVDIAEPGEERLVQQERLEQPLSSPQRGIQPAGEVIAQGSGKPARDGGNEPTRPTADVEDDDVSSGGRRRERGGKVAEGDRFREWFQFPRVNRCSW